MSELLTTREVQDLLKVDRITVYRMLNDGRIKGVKIGQQWRFHRSDVARVLAGAAPAEPDSLPIREPSSFPTHCVQTIQNLFCDVSGLWAIIIDIQGRPLTHPSGSCRLAEVLLSVPAGLARYQEAWQSFAQSIGRKFFTCPAGLQYIGAPIFERAGLNLPSKSSDRTAASGQLDQVGLFLAGGIYWERPDPREEAGRLRRLSIDLGLPFDDLQEAARGVPVIDPARHERVESWPFSAAQAVQSILSERVSFVERLQQIADLTQIP